jgi:NAD-dependent SIR2 family protein deacetylase
MKLEECIAQAVEVLSHADALLITAGAGMGVDSGLPDFRGNQGFWKAYPPIEKLGICFADMANPIWFHRSPKLAWAFYGHRLELYRNTSPHTGFLQLLNIAEHKKKGYFVFTSNVDGQFQKASYDENRIDECHGSIHYFQCTTPCNGHIWSADNIHVTLDEENFEAIEPLPRCPKCGALARPNILMFSDWSWNAHRTEGQSQRLLNWLNELQIEGSQLAIIEIGAGKEVATVRNYSEYAMRAYHAPLIRINPRDYEVPSNPPNNISIPLNGAEGIDHIVKALTM